MAKRECPFCGENMVASQTKIQGEISGIRFILEGIVHECPACHEKVYGPLSAEPLLCMQEGGKRDENLCKEQDF